VRPFDVEQRKQRRKVLFDIGIQLRRVYSIAEQQPVPERIARLLSELDGETVGRAAGKDERSERCL
jgi:hypothetical protein